MTLSKLVSTIAFLAMLTAAFGQGKEDKNSRLLNIRKVYQQINSAKGYKIVTIEKAEEFLGHNTDNGASLKGYFKGDTLKKIVEWIGISNGVIQNEYYLDGEKLIFVYVTESRYQYNEKLQQLNYSKLTTIFTGRYYFENEKLLDTILSDKNHNLSKEQDAVIFYLQPGAI